MTNEQRAEKVIKEYGFDFDNISKEEIIKKISYVLQGQKQVYTKAITVSKHISIC